MTLSWTDNMHRTWITSLGRMGAFIAVRADLKNPDFTCKLSLHIWPTIVANQYTGYQVPELSWSLAEISVAVLSICIPSWFYLIKRGSEHGMSSLFTTRSSDYSANRPPRGGSYDTATTAQTAQTGNFTKLSTSLSSLKDLSYPGVLKHSHTVSVEGGLTSKAEMVEDAPDLEMGGVNVRQDVSVDNEVSHPS